MKLLGHFLSALVLTALSYMPANAAPEGYASLRWTATVRTVIDPARHLPADISHDAKLIVIAIFDPEELRRFRDTPIMRFFITLPNGDEMAAGQAAFGTVKNLDDEIEFRADMEPDFNALRIATRFRCACSLDKDLSLEADDLSYLRLEGSDETGQLWTIVAEVTESPRSAGRWLQQRAEVLVELTEEHVEEIKQTLQLYIELPDSTVLRFDPGAPHRNVHPAYLPGEFFAWKEDFIAGLRHRVSVELYNRYLLEQPPVRPRAPGNLEAVGAYLLGVLLPSAHAQAAPEPDNDPTITDGDEKVAKKTLKKVAIQYAKTLIGMTAKVGGVVIGILFTDGGLADGTLTPEQMREYDERFGQLSPPESSSGSSGREPRNGPPGRGDDREPFDRDRDRGDKDSGDKDSGDKDRGGDDGGNGDGGVDIGGPP